jgi:4-aminobutyrate aminotransferase-like enzyme
MICLGKSFAMGVPSAAVIARRELIDAWNFAFPFLVSFGGNPLACRAALAGYKVIEEERLGERAAETGAYLLKRLRELAEHHRLVGDVRGVGLLIGMELVRDRETKEPARDETVAVCREAFRKGLIVAPYGAYSQVIRIFPPLNIEREQVDKSVDILDEALAVVERR